MPRKMHQCQLRECFPVFGLESRAPMFHIDRLSQPTSEYVAAKGASTYGAHAGMGWYCCKIDVFLYFD